MWIRKTDSFSLQHNVRELPQSKSHVDTQSMHSRRNDSYHQAPFQIDGQFPANVTAYAYVMRWRSVLCNYHQEDASRSSFSCDDLDAEEVTVINRQHRMEEDKARLMRKKSQKDKTDCCSLRFMNEPNEQVWGHRAV